MRKGLQDILDRIKAGDHVLTVNVRLSRYLCERYDSLMMAGNEAWPTPAVMPLSAWISFLWDESWPDRPLLSHVRSSALWEKVVSGDKLLPKEMLNRGVAKTAYDAYSLIREYRVELPGDLFLTEEAFALKRWICAYESGVERLGFVEPGALPELVISLVRERRVVVPQRVVLAGFDELTPRTAAIVKAVEDSGGEVAFWPERPGEGVDISNLKPFPVCGYADEVEEVVQAARWARKTLRPGLRIGFIAPELERYRDIIKREFTAELNPEGVLPWRESKEVFNISLGSPLSMEPLVRTAIEILSVGDEPLETSRISSLLLSPYFAASDDEFLALARLDAAVRKENSFAVTIRELGRAAERHKINGLDGFRQRLTNWGNLLAENRKSDLPSRWAEIFSRLLKDCGWPSGRFALNSVEFQALNAWNGLLNRFASLDEISGRISRTEAVSQLTRLANDAIHQPETRECPIQVMGLLESSGMHFDHVWMMGMHGDAFPSQPSPNPFIPLSVQKRAGLPHSSPERELAFAKRTMGRIFDSSDHIVMSYPKVVDKKELAFTPLLASCLDHDAVLINESSRIKDRVHQVGTMEDMAEGKPIPPSAEELAAISGGTAIIRNQSACPFRAFAIHRLNACGVEMPGLGLSAQNRGTIVHAALKAFWDRVKDSARLKGIAEGNELDRYIRDAVAEAFRRNYPIEPLSDSYMELEREAVFGLLKEWIEDVELERSDFCVDRTEYTKEMDIEGLKITARFDRVDRVGSGCKVIIDYKTGECSKNDWLTERPREPQLLIYNLSEDFEAISFARVKPGSCRFIGISKEDGVLPGLNALEGDRELLKKLNGLTTWDELTGYWKAVVKGVARQFLEGKAEVNPAARACEHCDLMGLCRIFEAESRCENEEDE